jgi:hypothetical protein
MQYSKPNNIDEEMLNRIIAVAYKDAPSLDRIGIYFLAKKNPEVKKLLNEYRRTANGVKKVPREKCPDSVVKSLEAKTLEKKKSFILKLAYVFTITVIVISTLVVVLLNQSKEKEHIYTKAEIELAEEQVKTSLAIVNRVFKKTEDLIQEDILPKRVAKPIHKSLSIINEVLIGG